MYFSSTMHNEVKRPPTMPIMRDGETYKLWFRSDRYFLVGNVWYFSTREKIDVGPYVSREAAEEGLELYIDCMIEQNMDADSAAMVALRGEDPLESSIH